MFQKIHDRYPGRARAKILLVNLRQIAKEIQQNIDFQTKGTQQILKRVIEGQVDDDFRSAEKQINDYIQKFQDEFDHLLKQRQIKEADVPKILERLLQQKKKLTEYLIGITQFRQSLDHWKPEHGE